MIDVGILEKFKKQAKERCYFSVTDREAYKMLLPYLNTISSHWSINHYNDSLISNECYIRFSSNLIGYLIKRSSVIVKGVNCHVIIDKNYFNNDDIFNKCDLIIDKLKQLC